METSNIQYCPNCNEKFTEVYMFPCMHNFCSKCTNLMKKGAKTTCLLCSSQCNEDEVKRNTILEKICSIESQNEKSELEMIFCELCDSDGSENQADKYCVDCSQYVCFKCSKIHVKGKISRDHKIVDKNDVKNIAIKWPESNCEKHKQSLTIHCKTCDSIICPTCCIINHADHVKSDDLDGVFAKSSSEITKKIMEIDDIIKSEDDLISENKLIETTCLQNCDKVCKEIEDYAKELKDQIDQLTKGNVDKLVAIKNDFIKSVHTNLIDITRYISLMKNLKIYFNELINKGSKIDLFNLKNELNKNKSIKTNKPELIRELEISFEKPSLDQFISYELIESFKFVDNRPKKDLIFMLKNPTISACVYKQNLYTVNIENKCLEIYDIETLLYKSSINFEQNLTCLINLTQYSNKDINNFYIFNTLNDLFLYYYSQSSGHTCIYKFNKHYKHFEEWKTLSTNCSISSTLQQTLLVLSSNMLFELSASFEELKRIQIQYHYEEYYQYNYANQLNYCVHKLKDGRYFITNSTNVSLLDSQGGLQNTFTLPSTGHNIRACTDGDKYIFVLQENVEKITVLSTNLQQLDEFSCPGVNNICYDQVKDKILLVKQSEIMYFTYQLGKMDSVLPSNNI